VTLRSTLFLLSLLLVQPATSVAQDTAPQRDPIGQTMRPGPPPPLAGIPIALKCDALLPFDHPALRRYPGQDLNDLAVEAEADNAQAWAQTHLCETLWEVLAQAGAHPAPDDVRLPARAVLTASLNRLWIEGSRVVEQRIGSTIMPVSIPHWAVAMSWDFAFFIDYSRAPEQPVERTGSGELELSLGGAAEQDDYAPLRMGALFRAAALEAFADLPWVVADDGHLGDLLFGLVAAPGSAPAALGVEGDLAAGFWQLLSTDARQRHDALAFYLSSPLVRFARRLELARWFLLNDPDLALRRDALGWVMQSESRDPEAELTGPTQDLLAWLILKDRSSRMRAEAVRVLSMRSGDAERALLVAASTDEDARVADRAITGLKGAPPPTAAELEAIPSEPAMPALASWTSALDGRVPAGSRTSRDQALLTLALASRSPAADTWMVHWAAGGATDEADLAWALDSWRELATAGVERVRREALLRLGRESHRPSVAEVLVSRIRDEPEAALKVVAIEGLQRTDVKGLRTALLKVSRSTDVGVRSAAVTALAGVRGRDVDERLTSVADGDPVAKVRRRARKALRTRAKQKS
jgi:hypothetical protein